MMRSPLTGRRAVVLGLLVAALGCVSLKRTPEARFFALRALADPPAAPAPGERGTEGGVAPGARPAGGLVGVLPVGLPGPLDRPQLVSFVGPGELRIDEFLRWAEPLDAGVARVLAENLSTLLPEARVVRWPWPARAPLRCRVRVDIARFGSQPEGAVDLEARVALLPGGHERPLLTRRFAGRRAAAPGDPARDVEAMSGLLLELSREVAAAVAGLPPAAPETAPERDEKAPADRR
jgi:hypothetical protein